MDLSQQELPLTAYFLRGSKESRPRVVARKKEKPSEEATQSVTRSSKRKRNDARCFPANPPSSSVDQSKSRPTTPQLPTPAGSARKRVRGGSLEELSEKSQLTSAGVSLSSVEHDVVRSSEKEIVRLEFGPTPSRPLRQGARHMVPALSATSLATPSTGQRKTTTPADLESLPVHRLSDRMKTGIPTPQTSSRRVSDPTHRIDHSPLVHSNRPLPSRPNNNASVPSDDTPVLPSKTMDGRPSDGYSIPSLPVPSSQSQYLLHHDATPKRKRHLHCTQHVVSSQTQEERELTLSSTLKPFAMVSSPVGASPGKHVSRGTAQTPRRSCNKRRSRDTYMLGSSPVKLPISTPTAPRRSFTNRKASNGLPSKSCSPSRRKTSTPCHSPSRQTRTPRRLARHDSIENVPPEPMDDSVTESESDSDILQVLRDGSCLTRHGLAQGNPPTAEDDSATEAESDTEILRCVAEIGKKRLSACSSEDDPPPAIISPLVSPARSRIATMPSILGSTPFSVREGGAEASIPGPYIPSPSTTDQPHIYSDSLPSVVREFIRMFPGDDSYPTDFPESLRV